MKSDEDNERISKTTKPQTPKVEESTQEHSLVQPLPKPDPALMNHAEASEEIDHNESTSES